MDNGKCQVEVEGDPCHIMLHYWVPHIWDKILGNIVDPKDVISCSEVCPDWKLLLQPEIPSAYFQLIFPMLLPYLDTRDILSCSAVSKDWNRYTDTSVNNFRNQVMCRSQSQSQYPQTRFPCLVLCENERVSKIKRFLAEKEEYACNQFDNPLVYRKVLIRDENKGNGGYEVFCQRLLKFLKQFGKYIHQLDLMSWNDEIIQLTRMVSICLSNTGNLKSLKCHFRRGLEADEKEARARQLNEFIEELPFPNSTIEDIQMYGGPAKLYEVLIQRYGNQLVCFGGCGIRINFKKLISNGVTLQNVKVFESYVYEDDQSYNLDYVTKLLPILKWTLSEVDIIVNSGEADFDYTALRLSFAKLFQALQKHQPQIQTLRLSTLEEFEFQPRGHWRPILLLDLESVTLPNLKQLTLDQVGLPPLQVFQKATPVLEYLTIYNEKTYEWIFPSESLDEMWAALPKCKMIQLGNFDPTSFQGTSQPLYTQFFIRN